MLTRENECVDCGRPCLGSACPYKSVIHKYCDCCGEEVKRLYYYRGEQMCEDCILEFTLNELREVRDDDGI